MAELTIVLTTAEADFLIISLEQRRSRIVYQLTSGELSGLGLIVAEVLRELDEVRFKLTRALDVVLAAEDVRAKSQIPNPSDGKESFKY